MLYKLIGTVLIQELENTPQENDKMRCKTSMLQAVSKTEDTVQQGPFLDRNRRCLLTAEGS